MENLKDLLIGMAAAEIKDQVHGEIDSGWIDERVQSWAELGHFTDINDYIDSGPVGALVTGNFTNLCTREGEEAYCSWANAAMALAENMIWS